MTEEEWLRDRILWKCEKNNLLNNGAQKFAELSDQEKAFVSDKWTSEDEPIIAFLDQDKQRSTIITCREIVSLRKGEIHSICLQEINKKVLVPDDTETKEEIAEQQETLLLGRKKIPIWVPAGKAYFGMMNLLQIFPLTVPGS